MFSSEYYVGDVTVDILFAKQLETNVIARNLAASVSTSKPILFALALEDKSPTTLRELSDVISKHCVMSGST